MLFFGLSIHLSMLKKIKLRPSPPASVSIQCDSYGVEVRWEYPDLNQDVQFQVKVMHDFNQRNSNVTQNLTRSLRLNISSMLFYPAYNRYIVNVTAVRGGEESEPTLSDIFSYNKYATAKIKCHLDFPEVELSPKDGKLHVQFSNPLQLYRNSPALRGLNDNLEYCIETEEVTFTFLSARSNSSTKNKKTSLEQSSAAFFSIITIYNPPVTMYVYPLLGVLLTLLFITGIIMLLVTKCNSEMKERVLPMFQYFSDFSKTHEDECRTLKVEPEPISVVKIEPAEDNKEQAPLLKMSDEERPSDTKDLGSVKSPYGPNDLVESEQSNQSGFYDCPHAPRQQEMSPGDMVESYAASLFSEVQK
uniref:Uncharacterized protein n=1 Tax=Sinocyclocheilus grahami TaxID=75366 RepID=A0A672RG09_SINGR